MTNFPALIVVTLATNISESLVSLPPGGDSKVVKSVTERVYEVRWKEGTNNFAVEFQRVPVATNFTVWVQDWRLVPAKIERNPLGLRDVITPPKPTR